MNRASAFAALFLMMSGQASGGTPLDPPAQYDHPYAGALIVHRINKPDVWLQCSDMGRQDVREDVAGCAQVGDEACTIYLATKTHRAPVADILRHEIAHCNGWASDHRNS
jgi:hypothetical protein